jgi:Lon protease-like protein
MDPTEEDVMARSLPMFPLGTVLMPHMVLPLHIFEPRYRTMFRDLMDGDREFGVVQIARGSETGGGDVRHDVGTIARVLQAEELEDGRWVAVTVGRHRLRVIDWYPDDPYPQARIEELAEDGIDDGVRALRDALLPRVRRLLALRSELGDETVPSTFEAATDDAIACWQLLVLSPLSDIDAQELLGIDGWDARLTRFTQLLTELEETGDLELHGRR